MTPSQKNLFHVDKKTPPLRYTFPSYSCCLPIRGNRKVEMPLPCLQALPCYLYDGQRAKRCVANIAYWKNLEIIKGPHLLLLVCSLVEMTWENSSASTEQCLVIELYDKDKNSFGQWHVKHYCKIIFYSGFERVFLVSVCFPVEKIECNLPELEDDL